MSKRVHCVTSLKRGFTLVELLVGIAIMSIILGITLSGGPSAIMKLSLSDNEYKAELLIREAQLQGSAINSVNGTYGGAGIFLNRASSSYVLKFKDRVDTTVERAIGIGNGLYDVVPVDEKETSLKMTNNHRIGTLCVSTSTVVSSTTLVCNTETVPAIDTITLAFERPKQTAHIYVNSTTSTEYSVACIQFDSVKSPEPGFVKSLLVYQSGMITKTSRTCK